MTTIKKILAKKQMERYYTFPHLSGRAKKNKHIEGKTVRRYLQRQSNKEIKEELWNQRNL